MARKDYRRYDPGTTVNFQPTRKVSPGRPHRPSWWKTTLSFIAIVPAVALMTIILSFIKPNLFIQFVVIIATGFGTKYWVDWKLGA